MINSGYYLFIYSEIDPLLNTLGLSLRHDQNMAVFQKKNNEIKLICHLEFERFTGKKHHRVAFQNRNDAVLFINKLLAPYKITLDDFEGVYGMPGINDDDDDLSYTSIFDVPMISYHAISHLFSSLLMDTDKFYHNNMIALAFDGGPDILLDRKVDSKYYFCGAVSKKGKIEYLPIASPGAYWEYAAHYFKKPEGTLMALAYASKTRSTESFDSLPLFYQAKDRAKVVKAVDLIISRILSYNEQDIGRFYTDYDNRFTDLENKISMIMKIVQELSVRCVFQQIDEIIQKYSISPADTILTLSGGYALNCPTNTQIMHKYHFAEQQCCPCVNDSGLAFGMGLYFFYKNCERFSFKFENSFYGYSDEFQLNDVLSQYSDYIESVDEDLDLVAEDIRTNPIIWIDGRAEIGPRALGHRSIIANPMNISHKVLLNKYKKREWWRPVAPIILEDDLKDWFKEAFNSPHMLNNFQVNDERKDSIPAVLHLDQSARVQTIANSDNQTLYGIIKRFKDLTGVPIICNTSLNDKGEPIINTIEQALNFALRKNISILYAYKHRIKLKNHEKYCKTEYLERDAVLFEKSEQERKNILDIKNPYHLSNIELLLYLYNPDLRKYDITIEKDVNILKKIIHKVQRYSVDLTVFDTFEREMIKL